MLQRAWEVPFIVCDPGAIISCDSHQLRQTRSFTWLHTPPRNSSTNRNDLPQCIIPQKSQGMRTSWQKRTCHAHAARTKSVNTFFFLFCYFSFYSYFPSGLYFSLLPNSSISFFLSPCFSLLASCLISLWWTDDGVYVVYKVNRVSVLGHTHSWLMIAFMCTIWWIGPIAWDTTTVDW